MSKAICKILSDQDISQTTDTAISLCRISALGEQAGHGLFPYEIQSLVFAAMVLTKVDYPEGILKAWKSLIPLENDWIRRFLERRSKDLQLCEPDLYNRYRELNIPEFMDKAEQCTSWPEIWTLKSGGRRFWEAFLLLHGNFIYSWA